MEPAAAAASAPKAVVFRDGLGERRHGVDATGNERIETLRLSSELTASPAFEFALRERVNRLANFRHACYGYVRSVDRLNDPGATLALVSECTPGVRLSEMLAVAERRRVVLDINAALCLIWQLVPAVAMLHENERDIAHGALGPERLVVTPQGRLVIVEYVMGASLERLRFSHARYWKDLRVALPRSAGLAHFDHRTDVTQLGVVALSLILGRLLREDEYPSRIREVVSSARAIAVGGDAAPLTPGLRSWLERALQFDLRDAFRSALEARAALDEVLLGDGDYIAAPASVEAFLARYHSSADAPAEVTPARDTAQNVTPRVVAQEAAQNVTPRVVAQDFSPAPSPAASKPVPPPAKAAPPATPAAQHVTPRAVAQDVGRDVAQDFSPASSPAASKPVLPPAKVAPPATPAAQNVTPRAVARDVGRDVTQDFSPAVSKPAPPPAKVALPPPSPPQPVREKTEALKPDVSFEVKAIDAEADEEAETEAESPRRWRLLAAAAVVLVAVASGGLLAARWHVAPAAPAATTGTLIVHTNPSGARVILDGQPRGVTPVNLTVSAGSHVVELRGAGEPRRIPVTITAGAETSQYIELPRSGPTPGQLQIRTDPPGAKVTVDGVPRGASPLTIGDLAPGEHTVALDSEAGSMKQSVTIESGTTASLVVPLAAPGGAPLSGWVAVSSPVYMQLYESGRLIGSSQGEQVVVPAGSHQIEIVNEPLGYRVVHSVQVAPGKVAPITIKLPNGTIALNAIPWAEVWIDGEKVGETPIGNLTVPIGPHEVVFRNPDLGEQRETISVTLTTPARLSVDLTKK